MLSVYSDYVVVRLNMLRHTNSSVISEFKRIFRQFAQKQTRGFCVVHRNAFHCIGNQTLNDWHYFDLQQYGMLGWIDNARRRSSGSTSLTTSVFFTIPPSNRVTVVRSRIVLSASALGVWPGCRHSCVKIANSSPLISMSSVNRRACNSFRNRKLIRLPNNG